LPGARSHPHERGSRRRRAADSGAPGARLPRRAPRRLTGHMEVLLAVLAVSARPGFSNGHWIHAWRYVRNGERDRIPARPRRVLFADLRGRPELRRRGTLDV